MRKPSFLLFLTTVLFSLGLNAQNFELRFEIVNNTGTDLYGVYVTDTDTDNWGDDIIPYDIFEDETVVKVSIPIDDETLCDYDIRITDDQDNFIEFENIDFCELQTLTLLTDKSGNLYYTVE